MKTRIFCVLLALTMLLSGCSSGAERESTPGTTDKPSQGDTSEPTSKPTAEPAQEPTPEPTPSGEVIASGECGQNVTWVLYEDGTLIISGTGPMEDYAAVSAIPWYEYLDSDSIITVVIDDGVTSIGTGAFYWCGLTSVVIPNSVTSIGESAFYSCGRLTSVTIPDSVTSIGRAVFAGCTSLISVTIPDSVTSIVERAFWGCGSLTDIYYSGSEAQWNQINIGNDENANASLLNANIHYNYNS